MTEFQLSLSRRLVEEKKVAETTAAAYLKTLHLLNDKKPFKNLSFLKNTETILGKMKDYAESTQRALLAAVVSVLSLFAEKPAYKKVYAFYADKMADGTQQRKENPPDTSKKSKKQEDNWMTWEEVNTKRNEMLQEVKTYGKKVDEQQFNHLLSTLVLSLYTLTQPRRNQDYLDMMVVKGKKEPESTETNYLLVDKTPKQFIFNKFKTAKKYGKQVIDIPEELKEMIALYLRHHPLKKDPVFPFLVSFDGTPLTAVNAITRILNRIFGKKVGSSMLRHIYLSSKYDIEEMTEDARAMGHSVEEQKKYLKGSGEVVQSVEVPTLSTTD